MTGPWLLSMLLCATGDPSPEAPDAVTSIHAQQAHANQGTTPVLLRRTFRPTKQGMRSDFTHTVFGYYPYWTDAAAEIPWQHLTHLAYFSVEVNADGSLGNDHGWSSGGADLVATGHANGVLVVLCATLFDGPSITTLLSSAANRDRLVQGLVDAVQAVGGDGVNIDFEGVPAASKTNLVTFMGELGTLLRATNPDAHLSIATPAVDWRGAFDYDLLAEATDGLMIMGYDYHWSSGDPGPISPISIGTTWSGQDLRWTVADYFEWGGAANADKFILGFPLYGRDWPSTGETVPGVANGSGTTVVLSSCEDRFASGYLWDSDSETPYQTRTEGTQAYQLFCEDQASLAAKLDLIPEYGIGGAMFWALGYAGASHPMWDEVDSRFRVPPNQAPVAQADTPAHAVVGDTIRLDGTGSFDPDGDPLTYLWTALEGPAITVNANDTAVATATPAEPGQYTFRLAVSDGDLADIAQVEVTVQSVDDAEQDSCAGCDASRPGAWLVWLLALGIPLRRRRQTRSGLSRCDAPTTKS